MIVLIDLCEIICYGFLFFFVMFFDDQDRFNFKFFVVYLEWLFLYLVVGFIVVGGIGELFFLIFGEVVEVVKIVCVVVGDVLVIVGCGYGIWIVCDMVCEIEVVGGDGILLLLYYLIEVLVDGIVVWVWVVCKVMNMGVIVYNCGQVWVSVEQFVQFVDECLNLIGFKDGIGDIDIVCCVIVIMGDWLFYIGGMFMYELFVQVYKGVGMLIYFLVVFNFVLEIVLKFYVVFSVGDDVICEVMLCDFYYFFVKICDCKVGYVVLVIKVGVCLCGFDVGLVCVLLMDLIDEEMVMM